MFVASSGWRRGVGRALMAAALDDLRERGYSEAIVWSFAYNDRANRSTSAWASRATAPSVNRGLGAHPRGALPP